MEQLPKGKKGGKKTLSKQKEAEETVRVFHKKGDGKLKNFAVQLKNDKWHVQKDVNNAIELDIAVDKPNEFTEFKDFTADEFYDENTMDKYNFHCIGEETIRAKWLMDGSRTLAEAAKCLRDEATRLENLAKEGWKLSDLISDDYGFITCKPKFETIGDFLLK